MRDYPETLRDARVVAVTGDSAGAPFRDNAAPALNRLCSALGWANHRGPFGAIVPEGVRVLVKPNWVLHLNSGPWGLEPLVTSPALIRAVVEGLLQAGAASVTVADAPLQFCDFSELMNRCGLDLWAHSLSLADGRFRGLVDLRRTRSQWRRGVRHHQEDEVPLERFVLFDLGTSSLLEPVTDPSHPFRVTQYDPDRLAQTHRRGRHQYLVGKQVLEADVIVNLPKLKTHKKAGVTNALKNVIGINGNKEFLPHHRKGGADAGGDCYPGGNLLKSLQEDALDLYNRRPSGAIRHLSSASARLLNRACRWFGDGWGVEGSWSGNDTIWRTCLDLNRVLHYGHIDGSLDGVPRRQVLNICDGVVAGQGDGPLSPEPFHLNVLFGGRNGAAVDWVAASMLGFDPTRIPLVREAFSERAGLASFAPGDIDFVVKPSREFVRPDRYPAGWINAVRRGATDSSVSGRVLPPAESSPRVS